MRIAFVYDAVYPWVKGGAEKRIYEVGKRLAEQGNEVHVFGVKWWDGDEVIKYEGMALHGVCRRMELYVDGRRSITGAIIFSVKLFPHLLRERFDVMDVSAFPYFSCFTVKLASILWRTPMIITWHEVWGDYWYEYLGYKGFFGKLVEFLAAKLTSKMVAVSDPTRKNLKFLGVGGQNIHVVPNGIDLKRIADILPSNEKCDIIFVGRLIKEKNVDVLLEAVDYIKDKLPDLRCHIVGNGPEKECLIKVAAERGLNDNVKFFEFMRYEEVIARMKSSKVLVLPSTREGFGVVVIEAFACGVPVVTVKSPMNAACGLVNEKTGLVVNLDANEIGNAFYTLVTNNLLREKMATSVRKAAEEYNWDDIVRKLKMHYEDVTKTEMQKI
jgi:glycosyltransferase involved in cell wall biosynthesis